MQQSFRPDEFRLEFKSSNINIARDALALFRNIGAKLAWQDVNGGKAVGGYFASAFINNAKAKALNLI